VSHLELPEFLRTHFAMGVISMLLPSEGSKSINFAVSTTIIQKGFSGSAVFRPNGDIVGVLIKGLSFPADKPPDATRYLLPVVSAIGPLIGSINAAISMKR
jgi:hypothetical protein